MIALRVPGAAELGYMVTMLLSKMQKQTSLSISRQRVLGMVEAGHIDAAIMDESYLLFYKIAPTWYSNDLVLYELGVYRIGAGSTFSRYLSGMDYLAEEFGCKEIHVGTAAARRDEALARLYKRGGYEQHAVGLRKRLWDGS